MGGSVASSAPLLSPAPSLGRLASAESEQLRLMRQQMEQMQKQIQILINRSSMQQGATAAVPEVPSQKADVTPPSVPDLHSAADVGVDSAAVENSEQSNLRRRRLMYLNARTK